jgi:hypothetical protein
MRWISFRAPAFGKVRQPGGRRFQWGMAAAGLALLTLGGSAQINPPSSQPPKPLIIPAANPTPDANAQMEMRERNLQTRHFDRANAVRLRQMMKASDMLETLAMALKAEVDKPGPPSETEIQKAENIEKLAKIVKEQMKLTPGPN